MRTDSVRIAAEALGEAREYIQRNYDPAFLPPKARVFKVAGAAQDAHEAIRPSSLAHPPQAIKPFLTPDQFRLYQLIWNRFLACQMNPAVLDQTTVDIAAANCLFRAQGSVMKFPGFTILYTEGKEDNGDENGFGKLLPEVRQGETLKLLELKPEQKFTQPPPRFSEASLVRELEEKGIGRPSTYASILTTIQDREYVLLEKGKFIPTDLGILVTDLLVKNFPRILDVAFTAEMETELDRIEEGKTKRLDILNNFYLPFQEELRKAKANMTNVKREETPTDLVCEKCGKPMVIKWGKNGRFLACTNYPACKNTKNFKQDEKGEILPEDKATDIPCPLCGKPMTRPAGTVRKIPRLFRLSRVQAYDKPGPGWNACRRPGGRRPSRGGVREVRQADGPEKGSLRRFPGLHRLSGMQEHRQDLPLGKPHRPGGAAGNLGCPLRQMRQADRREDGTLRQISRLHRLPRMPEHHEVQKMTESTI